MRPQTKRRTIASRDPRAQQMWTEVVSPTEIARAFGHVNAGISFFGCIDPAPQPIGCPPLSARACEGAEERAFRRFPITSHKPGP